MTVCGTEMERGPLVPSSGAPTVSDDGSRILRLGAIFRTYNSIVNINIAN